MVCLRSDAVWRYGETQECESKLCRYVTEAITSVKVHLSEMEPIQELRQCSVSDLVQIRAAGKVFDTAWFGDHGPSVTAIARKSFTRKVYCTWPSYINAIDKSGAGA